jgi:hypothetical protein
MPWKLYSIEIYTHSNMLLKKIYINVYNLSWLMWTADLDWNLDKFITTYIH